MKNKPVEPNRIQKLCEILCQINQQDTMQSFIKDLCTHAEIEALADRIWIIPMIIKKMSYREIHKQTGVSLTTICRVANALNNGCGGYKDFFTDTKSR